jgi:hypothetical protein
VGELKKSYIGSALDLRERLYRYNNIKDLVSNSCMPILGVC